MAEGPAKSTGWQLLGRIQSALSLTELSNITAQQLIDALKVQSHDDIAIEVPSRQSTMEGSWSSTRHEQLHLLLGAVTNVLQLYGGTDAVSNSLSCAPMVELLLLEASALLAKAVECRFSVEPHQHMPIYQQRGQLPEHVMFVLQLLAVVEDCCLIDTLEAACLQAVTDLPTACQAPSQHAHVPYLYAQILTMQVQVMQITAAVKPQHRCFRSKGVLESFAGCALALLRLSDADFQPDNTPASAVSTAAATAESAPADASHWPEGYWQRQQRSLSAEVQPAVLSCASLLFTSFSEACSSVEHNPAGGNLRVLDARKVPCFIDLALLLMAMYVALVHRQHAERVRTTTDSVASSSSSSSGGGGGRPSSRSSNSHCSSSGSRDSGASLPQQQQQQWEPWPAQQAPDYHSALLQQVPNHEQLLRGSWWCLSRGCLNASDWLLLDLHVSALKNVVKHVGPLSGDAFVRWGRLLVERTLLLQIKDGTQLWRLDSALGALQSACMPGGERQQGLTAQGTGYSQQQQQQGWRCSDFEYMGLLPEEAQQLLLPVLQQLAPFVLHTLQQTPAVVRAWDEKGRAKLQDWPQEYAQHVEQLQHMRRQLQNPQEERLQRGTITEEQHAWYEGMFQEMEISLEQLRLRHLIGQELAKHVQEVQKQRNSMLQAVDSFTGGIVGVYCSGPSAAVSSLQSATYDMCSTGGSGQGVCAACSE